MVLCTTELPSFDAYKMSTWVATWTDNVAILAEIFVSIPFVTVLIIAPANFELKMRKLYPYE